MQVEIIKRKSPRLFNIISIVMVIINEGLYVYDLYTDVIVVMVRCITVEPSAPKANASVPRPLPLQFFYHNDYKLATALSLTFIVNHYIIISAMLTYWMRGNLMGLITSKDEDKEAMAPLISSPERSLPGDK